MFESWIVGILTKVGTGSLLGFLFVVCLIYTGTVGWCVMRILNLCASRRKMSEALTKKVERNDFDEKIADVKSDIEKLETSNKTDHDKLCASSTEQLRILSFIEGRLSSGKGIEG
jgi:hypothetical protein